MLKRTPLSVSVSRDGGLTWERTVSVAWKSFWHYGYPKGIELPGGDILFFSRYGPLHDAVAMGVTRVYFQSSWRGVGKPSSANAPSAPSRDRANQSRP